MRTMEKARMPITKTVMVVQARKQKKPTTIEAQKGANVINIVLVASWCNLIKAIKINL